MALGPSKRAASASGVWRLRSPCRVAGWPGCRGGHGAHDRGWRRSAAAIGAWRALAVFLFRWHCQRSTTALIPAGRGFGGADGLGWPTGPLSSRRRLLAGLGSLWPWLAAGLWLAGCAPHPACDRARRLTEQLLLGKLLAPGRSAQTNLRVRPVTSPLVATPRISMRRCAPASRRNVEYTGHRLGFGAEFRPPCRQPGAGPGRGGV